MLNFCAGYGKEETQRPKLQGLYGLCQQLCKLKALTKEDTLMPQSGSSNKRKRDYCWWRLFWSRKELAGFNGLCWMRFRSESL
ncbi:hypothetical protein RM96_21205 [Cupriavidus sp. IDO]|nr:hypothetical protein RM96_21205 [Cupriavidus sp. IDO]